MVPRRLLLVMLVTSACGFEVGGVGGGGDDVPADAPPSGCKIANWRDEHWAARYPLAIQKTRVRGMPGDVAVLVAITSAELKQAAASADDVVFTAGDGMTVLPSEIERFDVATGALLAWVRVPGLTNASDTPLYLYFANPAPPPPDRGEVWPDYVGVWHFRDDPGAVAGQARDSSSHGRHMTVQNMTSEDSVAGKIGSGFRFDGVDNGLVLTPFVFPQKFSYEAWIRPTTLSGYHTVFDIAANSRWFGMANDKLEFYTGLGHVFDPTITGSQWHAIAVTYDGAMLRGYLDGNSIPMNRTVTLSMLTSPLRIGFSVVGEYFLGTIDEARFYTGALRADVIGTSYANQAMPDQFVKALPIERCR